MGYMADEMGWPVWVGGWVDVASLPCPASGMVPGRWLAYCGYLPCACVCVPVCPYLACCAAVPGDHTHAERAFAARRRGMIPRSAVGW